MSGLKFLIDIWLAFHLYQWLFTKSSIFSNSAPVCAHCKAILEWLPQDSSFIFKKKNDLLLNIKMCPTVPWKIIKTIFWHWVPCTVQ